MGARREIGEDTVRTTNYEAARSASDFVFSGRGGRRRCTAVAIGGCGVVWVQQERWGRHGGWEGGDFSPPRLLRLPFVCLRAGLGLALYIIR